MGRKLQLRRGLKSQMPVLLPGEPAWVTDENKLYIGTENEDNIGVSMDTHTHSQISTLTVTNDLTVGTGASVNFNNCIVSGVANPGNDNDAANKKYVDTKIAESGGGSSTLIEAILDPAQWAGSGPYTQSLSIAGMTSTKNGIVGINPAASPEARAQSREAILQLTSQGTDTVTITADGSKPTLNIPIVITMLG